MSSPFVQTILLAFSGNSTNCRKTVSGPFLENDPIGFIIKKKGSQPDPMVPTMSNMPIAANRLAAPTAGSPKPAQSGTKCDWISPLVLAPQMKNVPNKTQNTPVLLASRKACHGEIGAAGMVAATFAASSPAA